MLDFDAIVAVDSVAVVEFATAANTVAVREVTHTAAAAIEIAAD